MALLLRRVTHWDAAYGSASQMGLDTISTKGLLGG
jgi:hypothetical protein